jgi:hypothetical protein
MTHVVAFQPGSSIPVEVQRLVHQWVVVEAGSEVRLPLVLRPQDLCGGGLLFGLQGITRACRLAGADACKGCHSFWDCVNTSGAPSPLQCLAGVHAMVVQLILGGAVCVIGGTVGNVHAVVENITSADDDMSELYKKTVDLWVPAVLEGTASVERWTRRHLTFLSKSAMRWTVCASRFPGDAGTGWGTSVRVCMGGGVHQGM